MKYLKLYENFDYIKLICRKYELDRYTINQDGSVDVNADVKLTHKLEYKIQLKFGKVLGFFDCGNNLLTSLKGCPVEVGGYFRCSQNKKLTTLIDGPKKVGDAYFATNCNLMDFYGFPEKHEGLTYFINNPVSEILDLIFDEGSIFDKDGNLAKFVGYLNEYNVIKGKKIFEEGLKQAYYMVTKQELTNGLYFKYYKLI